MSGKKVFDAHWPLSHVTLVITEKASNCAGLSGTGFCYSQSAYMRTDISKRGTFRYSHHHQAGLGVAAAIIR